MLHIPMSVAVLRTLLERPVPDDPTYERVRVEALRLLSKKKQRYQHKRPILTALLMHHGWRLHHSGDEGREHVFRHPETQGVWLINRGGSAKYGSRVAEATSLNDEFSHIWRELGI